MGITKDMTGMVFSKLTVIREFNRGCHQKEWLCQCECGNQSIVRGGNLRSGHTKSCGRCGEFERVFVEENDHIRCTLKNGRSFIFDPQDFSTVKSRTWSVSNTGYVIGDHCKLHRLLMGNPCGKVVDHINGNPSDCRRSNLRIATQHDNTKNCALPKNSSTGYKGVCLDKSKGKYMAHIHPDRKMKFLGYFDTPEEAALAYDKAASFYFGNFARLNFEHKRGSFE